ncbi:LytTR family transcriptional regulator DNA-binding domain-containing protein [Paenibacillus nasutitermitis]|uniref:HTH LytTR-type domain-containing protein n=1 Tax=Paenibacillus nasutitermitis TaxID=1652958 RepID=A0A916YWB5_9BACL|nr:LytTR family transcriptional regulator DNA-binding domain-containing protein [Paenibacillus nasutitermitis]GGD64388.1 hypothetical protein GCM10010911_22660 [Paenibacillus nasutitermitis]
MQQCKQLSVSLDIDGKKGLQLININDMIYFEYDGIINRIMIHTLKEKFYTMGTLKYFVELLNNSGFNFKVVDRNNVVNIDNIVYLDGSTKKAYFEYPVVSGSKGCTFSGKLFDEVYKDLAGGSVITT